MTQRKSKRILDFALDKLNNPSCLVCGGDRNDDSTGITCGRAKCLAELGKEFVRLRDENKENQKEINEEKEIAEERKKIVAADLREIAIELGLNLREISFNDTTALTDKIMDEILDIKAILRKTEKE